jgi:hypothetical protein
MEREGCCVLPCIAADGRGDKAGKVLQEKQEKEFCTVYQGWCPRWNFTDEGALRS